MEYRIGIDIGGTNIAVGVVDENKQIVARTSVKTNAGRMLDDMVHDMAVSVREAVAKAGITLQDCYGRYLSMADPHNSFNVSAEMPADGHIWTLYCLDGNYKLVNNMNGKTLCYSTSYTSWGIYSKIDSDRKPLIKVIAVEPPADPANA